MGMSYALIHVAQQAVDFIDVQSWPGIRLLVALRIYPVAIGVCGQSVEVIGASII